MGYRGADGGSTVSLLRLLKFFRNSKLHAAPEEDEAMELGVTYDAGDKFGEELSFHNI